MGKKKKNDFPTLVYIVPDGGNMQVLMVAGTERTKMCEFELAEGDRVGVYELKKTYRFETDPSFVPEEE